MNKISKEDKDIKLILEEYIKKIETNSLSYEEKLNAIEFFIQHKYIQSSSTKRKISFIF